MEKGDSVRGNSGTAQTSSWECDLLAVYGRATGIAGSPRSVYKITGSQCRFEWQIQAIFHG